MRANAYQIHKDAWEQVLSAAHDGAYQKYSLYTSRSLAVKHPEVYLTGDNLFWEMAHSTAGFHTAYETLYAADEYMMSLSDKRRTGQSIEGPPLSLQKIDPREHAILDCRFLYPEGYPFFPLLDQRIAPLAVSLKAVGKRISPIEAAEQAYFREKEGGKETDDLYLMFCDDEGAYLCTGGVLWSMRDGERTKRPKGNPILIFNEEYVWYPLMGRDDTRKSKTLRTLVDTYPTRTELPSLTAWEKQVIRKLQDVTALRSDKQLTLGSLLSARAHGLPGDSLATTWTKILLPAKEFDRSLSRSMGVVRECNRFANYLSPVAAHLANVIKEAEEIETGIRSAAAEYLQYAGVVRQDDRGWRKPGRLEAWGHLWCCGVMEYNIDDSYRSRGGHCVSQSINLSAVLDLAGVQNCVTHFETGMRRTHHFICSMDGDFVIDNGIVNYFAKDHEKTGDWGPLLSFSKQGNWASTVRGKVYGSLSPREILEALEEIKRCICGRFELRFLKDDQVMSYDAFAEHLASEEAKWKPVELP